MLVSCLECGKEFSKQDSQIKKSPNHYCSKSCAGKRNNKLFPKRKKVNGDGAVSLKNTKQERRCLCCGEDITKKHKEAQYCSVTCVKRTRELRVENGTGGARLAKNYLIAHGEAQCAACMLTTWNEIPITLELDHIDGNSENNQLENLRLLCPNCHSQTETWKNRNKGNGRHSRRQRYANGLSY